MIDTAIDLTRAYELRGKKVTQLQEQVRKHVLSYEKLYAESLNLKDENDQLIKLKYENDATIENQKYQLGKYAEELEQLQEEIHHLRFFTKRFLGM